MSASVMFGGFVLVFVTWLLLISCVWYGWKWHLFGWVVAVVAVLIILWRLGQ